MSDQPAPSSDDPGRTAHVARNCLVLGGARSGKSAFAQQLAEGSRRSPVYLATATVWDNEMRERVARHRGDRDDRWRTVEEPLGLVETLAREATSGAVVLVDCLTLWLTNLMLADQDVTIARSRLVELLPRLAGPTIFVTNEVGSGIVPDNALARRFRDEQGRLNQAVAAACDTVVLVSAGLPVLLKPSRMPLVSL